MKKISLWLSIIIICLLSIGSVSATEQGAVGKIQKIIKYKTFIKSENNALSLEVEVVGDKQMILQTRKEMIETAVADYQTKEKALNDDISAFNTESNQLKVLADNHNSSKPSASDSLAVATYNYEASKLEQRKYALIESEKKLNVRVDNLATMKAAILESKEGFDRSYEALMVEAKAFDVRSGKFLAVSKEFTAFMDKNCPSLLQDKKTHDDASSLGCSDYVTGK